MKLPSWNIPTRTTYLGSDYSFEQLNPYISLRAFSAAYGYNIIGLSLRTGEYTTPVGGNSPKYHVKTQTTIMVVAMICNNRNGRISYLTICPYYRINQKIISSYPKTCDDVLIRFSIRRDGEGFFEPKWISCIKGEQEYTPYQAGSNKVDYVSFSDNCLTYDGFSAKRALESTLGLQESLKKAFIEWLSIHSTRFSRDDSFSGRIKLVF